MDYLALAIPVLAVGWLAIARPRPRTAWLVAAVALVAEAPAIALLVDSGGIECPCDSGQDFLIGLVFLALPLTVVVLAGWAIVVAARSR